jgi:aspartyl-tRNA(Asn)/glutamyl-tRNA(Gln) amidotransferase subunit A
MLTAAAAAERIRLGEYSAVDLLEACIERIDALDPKVQAWVEVDRAGARLTARQRYEASKHGAVTGSLFGVPVGIKDIFDVAGMPTRAGAPTFAHYTPNADSNAVARLRNAGAIILGKTATTQFAYADPAPTRNPWDVQHTPGGSSSGSAAAVAAGMVPVALGTQTVGSVLRPAAYCGVVGLKPTYGRIGLSGVVELARSLDHVGIFTRNVRDAALVLDVIAGHDPQDPLSLEERMESCSEAVRHPQAPPKLGLARSFYAGLADAEVSAHLDEAAARLRAAGAHVRDIELPATPQGVLDTGMPVLRYEAAAYHRERFGRHAAAYGPRIRSLIEQGLGMSEEEYREAQEKRARFAAAFATLTEQLDAVLLPVAPSTAPRGLESTGDPVFCAPASFAGLPAVSLPSGVGAGGLPLAIQLVAAPRAEPRLLSAASWAESVFAFDARPPL